MLLDCIQQITRDSKLTEWDLPHPLMLQLTETPRFLLLGGKESKDLKHWGKAWICSGKEELVKILPLSANKRLLSVGTNFRIETP